MATIGIIRKNIDTGEYEHFVVNSVFELAKVPSFKQIKKVEVIADEDYFDGIKTLLINDTIKIQGYWSAFVGDINPSGNDPMGNYSAFERQDNIITKTTLNSPYDATIEPRDRGFRKDGSGKIYILDEITSASLSLGPVEVDLPMYDNEDYNDVIDTSIYELLPAQRGLPIFIHQPSDKQTDYTQLTEYEEEQAQKKAKEFCVLKCNSESNADNAKCVSDCVDVETNRIRNEMMAMKLLTSDDYAEITELTAEICDSKCSQKQGTARDMCYSGCSVSVREGLIYEKIYDLGLVDLVQQINESGLRYNKLGNIVHTEEGRYTIYVLKDYPLKLYTVIKDPVTGTKKGLRGSWNRDGDVYKDIYSQTDVSITLEKPSAADSTNWVCTATNRIGAFDSNRFVISVEDIDKIDIFNKNLIKNGDFNNGMSQWDIIEGDPIISYEYDPITGEKKNKLTEDMFKTPVNAKSDEIKGPPLSEILDFKEDLTKQKHQIFHYLNGGVLDENENIVCRLKQTIDLSDYKQWIDGEVNGIRAIYGNLFAWMGGAGTHPALMESQDKRNIIGAFDFPSQDVDNWTVSDDFVKWRPEMIQPNVKSKGRYAAYFPHEITIGDRVSVVLKMYDSAKNLIESRFRIVNPTHKFNDIRMFLRQQNIYIPHGTRTIDVEIIFEKQYTYDIYNFYKTEDRSSLIRKDGTDPNPLLQNFYNKWVEYSNNNGGKKDINTFLTFTLGGVNNLEGLRENNMSVMRANILIDKIMTKVDKFLQDEIAENILV